jgi:hypothetical protein
MQGDDRLAASITPAGTVSGANVKITVSFPTAAGADTVSMVGSPTNTTTDITLAGTYTDAQGDAGIWSGSTVPFLSGGYSGRFQSTAHPLPIASSISLAVTQDGSFNLTGTAMITSWPCNGSLTLSGQALGQAFRLTDAANKVRIIAVPATNTAGNWNFTYNIDPTAPNCAGDFGRGFVSNQSPWNY